MMSYRILRFDNEMIPPDNTIYVRIGVPGTGQRPKHTKIAGFRVIIFPDILKLGFGNFPEKYSMFRSIIYIYLRLLSGVLYSTEQ